MPDDRAQASRTARDAGRPDPSDDDDEDEEEEDSSSAESSSEEDGGEEGNEAERESEESSDDDDDNDDDDSEESTSTPTVRARSGITYDLRHLDRESGARAVVGLTGQFEVVNCRSSDSGYDFQLLDRPRVHLGSDSPTCTCSTFQAQPEVACHHIFVRCLKSLESTFHHNSANTPHAQWLLDQLHGCFLNPSSAEVAISRDGRPRVQARIEDLLKGKLESVADQLNWQFVLEPGDEAGTGMTRADKVRDLLSAFSPKILPEDFRQDLVEPTTQTRTAEQCVVQGDFEATIFRLAVHDDGVFSSLCKAMPSGACASIYFDKILEQARRVLLDFDQYCATGQRPTDPSSLGGGIAEVDQVVLYLRQLVNRIQTNITARSPHGSEGATKALIWILDTISARNRDPLEGQTWGRTSFHGEDEDQRNLYHLLIGSEDMGVEPDAELFVIDALETLPPSDIYQFISVLRGIQRKIEVHRAPREFLLRLGALVRVAESAGVPGAMGSGQKRPAAGTSGGYSKRSR